MNRRRLIAGNWKMNNTPSETESFLRSFLSVMKTNEAVDVLLFPPFVALDRAGQLLAETRIALGGQNVHFAPKGAFTGEISCNMLLACGCRYVLIGHSERRHIIGETDELINQKLLAVLAGGLEVIFCMGELLEERESNLTEEVLERQIRSGLAGVTAEQMARVTVAYEPVWAIGTGKTATSDQAQEAHKFSRVIIADKFGDELAQQVRIQYGGSVKPENAAELMARPDVDGALVGGASLKLEAFLGIVEAGASLG